MQNTYSTDERVYCGDSARDFERALFRETQTLLEVQFFPHYSVASETRGHQGSGRAPADPQSSPGQKILGHEETQDPP